MTEAPPLNSLPPQRACVLSLTERVLLVDDDPNVLKAYERRLRRRFVVETALCSEEGVTAVNFLGPFAVIVSDMTMPRENGADFLARMVAVSPDSVRVMLTGNADQTTAARAVNTARVFRFLNKPCPADELEEAIEAGIAEHRRLRAERELMALTVHGVVSTLTQVLSLVSPAAFGRAARLRGLAGEVAVAAEVDDPWELEIAAALSQLGAVTLTPATIERLAQDEPLEPAEALVAARRFAVAAELVGEVPRLGRIARIVALQGEGAAPSDDPRVSRDADLLRVILVFDHLVGDRGVTRIDALHRLLQAAPRYEPAALDALRKVVARRDSRELREVGVRELRVGMRLVEDIATLEGLVLVTKGQDVTPSLRARLTNYASSHRLRQPIRVLVDPNGATAAEAASVSG